MWKSSRSFRGLLLFTLCFTVALCGGLVEQSYAQVLYGTLTGQVSDQTGAAIPGADVKATNPVTNFSQTTISNDVGVFTLPNMPDGLYTLSVSLPGFQETVVEEVSVGVGNVTRQNVVLQVGEITTSVTVSGAATLLKTDTTDVSVQLETKEITDLPLGQFRNYQSLLNLVPGATPGRFQNAITDTPGRNLSTNVNGTNRNANGTRIDGAASVNVWLPHHSRYVPPSDTIEVVNITTNNFDAEVGFAGGAAITVITKSGTNDIHGTAFWYHENQALNARDFFNFLDTDGDGKADQPGGRRHIWGGTIGGPIIKDKLFYFGGFEATQMGNSVVRTSTVATADQRLGDFSAYDTTIFDPLTGDANGQNKTAFENNIIPEDRLSPAALKMQALLPLPNLPGTRNNHEFGDNEIMNRYNTDLKADWYRSDSHRIWGKFSWLDAVVRNKAIFGPGGGGSAAGSGDGFGDTDVRVYGIGHNWTLSPTFLIDGNFSYSDFDQNCMTLDVDLGNYGLDVLGIPGVNAAQGQDQACIVDGFNRCGGLPEFQVSGFRTFGQPDGWNVVWRDENSLTFTQNASWTKGNHEFRFGYDLVQHYLNHWQPESGWGPRGGFHFGGDITANKGGDSPTDQNSWAAYVLGLPDTRGKSLQWENLTGKEWQHAVYFRDRWQVTPKLTLTLGLRYEYYPLLKRDNWNFEVLNLGQNAPFTGDNVPSIPCTEGGTKECLELVLDNDIGVSKGLFAPRLGFAYRISDNDVIRSGFGVTYSPLPVIRPMRGAFPLTIRADYDNVDDYVAGRTLDEGVPLFVGPDTSPGARLPVQGTISAASFPQQDFIRGYIQSWNVMYERKLPGDFVVSTGYVGTGVVHQLARQHINWSAPGGGNGGRQLQPLHGNSVRIFNGWLSSNYHSLQIALNRRFTQGLFMKGAYTYGRAINMTDDEGGTPGWNDPTQIYRNRAQAGYNRPHILQLATIYNLPFNDIENSFGNALLRDWQINGIFSVNSQTAGNVSGGGPINNRNNTQTADKAAELVKLGGIGRGDPYYNTDSFVRANRIPGEDCTNADCYGTSGRNIVRGPTWVNLDLSFFRNFPVKEDIAMEFRAEFLNFTNTPHFDLPNRSATSSSFMEISSTSANARERVVRFALKLKF